MARQSRFPTKWKPLAFARADYLNLPRKRHGPIVRRGLSLPKLGESELESRAVPLSEVLGSLEERILYKALSLRKIPFDFQSSMIGGRMELGGMVADFILLDRNAIIRVQGTIWHTGIVAEARDKEHRAIMENMGYVVWDIWDWEIRNRDLMDDWLRRHIDRGRIV